MTASPPIGITARVQQALDSGKSREEVVRDLVSGGLSAVTAERFVERALLERSRPAAQPTRTPVDSPRAAEDPGGRSSMISGAFWLSLGCSVTGATYLLATPGQKYTVMYGAVVAGLIGFARGAVRWLHASQTFPWAGVLVAALVPPVGAALLVGVATSRRENRRAARQAEEDDRVSQARAMQSAPPATQAPATPEPPPHPDVARVAALSERAGPSFHQSVRLKALESLANLGPRARDAVPVFVKALEDADSLIRGAALRGLPSLQPDPEVGIAAVTPLLKDPHVTNQVSAASALAEFGQTEVAVAYLMVHLKGAAKGWAAAGLARIGPEARGAVPLLTEMLEKRQNPYDGYGACHALGAIGRDASSALPALREASQDVDKSVRGAAAQAIREIEKP